MSLKPPTSSLDSLNMSGYLARLQLVSDEAREMLAKERVERPVTPPPPISIKEFEKLIDSRFETDEGPLALSCQFRCLDARDDCDPFKQFFTVFKRPCQGQCCPYEIGVFWKYHSLCQHGLGVALADQGHNEGVWVFKDGRINKRMSDELP